VRSIKTHGIIQPLVVRPLDTGDYELVAGERRYRAAKEVGLTEVPVAVRNLTAVEAAQLALIENLQREDLNPVEETEGVLQLLAFQLNGTIDDATSLLYRIRNQAKSDPSYNVIASSEVQLVQQVFDTLGQMTWDSFIINRLPLLKLPEEILSALRSGKIVYTKATAIARVKNVEARQQLLEDAIEQNLSLSQLKEQIKLLQLPGLSEAEAVEPTIASRLKRVYQTSKKTQILENSKKRKQVEDLLEKLERLMFED
jgi:ParB family transcriptional regulator, chromosome partitioning protein